MPPGIQIFRAAAGGGVLPRPGAGGGGAAPGRSGRLVRDSGGHHGGGLQERPGLPVRGGGPGRGVPPSAGGVQPGPGGDHRKTGGPKGALVLRTGGADPSVKGRQKDREKSQDNFLKK